MAKKIRRRKTPLTVLFIELMIPWIVMGTVAAVAFMTGLPDYAAIVTGLAAALAVTFFIKDFERRRRESRSS